MTAYWLAAAAFVVVYVVPFLKYPASPPGASDPSTIGRRTLLYVTMIAVSVLAAVVAARVRPALGCPFGELGRWARVRGDRGGGGIGAAVGARAGLALPSVHEVPRDFPATTLWRFREASLGMQAVLWSAIGLVFGPAAQRVMGGKPVIPRRLARHAVVASADE